MKTLPNPGRNANDLLNIACYRTIEKHVELTGEPPTGLFFNKILSVLNKELEAENTPLGLPHAWYRWGDEVVRILMPSALEWVHEDPPRTVVTWGRDPPELPTGVPGYDRLLSRVDSLVTEYSPRGRIEDLVNYVYSYAPFPFQDAYRRLRNVLLDLKGSEVPLDWLTTTLLLPPLKAAMEVFPYGDFPEFGNRPQPFERVMEALIRADVEGFRFARELSEAFWFAFCYHLRLHPRARQNVPESTVDHWRMTVETQMVHYDKSFDGILLDAVEALPRFEGEPGVADLAGRAREVREEDLAFIHGFDRELDEIGKFLAAARRANPS